MKNLSTPEVQMKGAWSDQQIAGMPMMIFLGLATCVLYAGWNGSLPLGMVGALALMFVLGTLLGFGSLILVYLAIGLIAD